MARINVEASFLIGKRFEKLMMKLGSKRAALGAVFECWTIAQRYWKYSNNGIPRGVWQTEELADELIEVGLAEDRGDFIYVKGSMEHFAWIRKAVESGKKGGRRPSLEIIKENGETPLATLTRTLPSSSSSSSFSKNKTNTLAGVENHREENQGDREREKAELADCVGAWGYALTHFQIHKDPKLDSMGILRMIRSRGYESTRLAILGTVAEASTSTFRPGDHVSISRVEKHFSKFTNLGAKVLTKIDAHGTSLANE